MAAFREQFVRHKPHYGAKLRLQSPPLLVSTLNEVIVAELTRQHQPVPQPQHEPKLALPGVA